MYLGISVTHLFANPLLERTKHNFTRWSTLLLSLAGCNSVKMYTLPTFLYLFQCILVFITKAFFLILQTRVFLCLFGIKSSLQRISSEAEARGGQGITQLSVLLPVGQHSHYVTLVTVTPTTGGTCSVMLPLPFSVSKLHANPLVCYSLWLQVQFRRHFSLQSISMCNRVKNYLLI